MHCAALTSVMQACPYTRELTRGAVAWVSGVPKRSPFGDGDTSRSVRAVLVRWVNTTWAARARLGRCRTYWP